MKPIILVLGGFLTSVATFGAGAAATAWLLVAGAPEPAPKQGVADLWTTEPQRVTGVLERSEPAATAVEAVGTPAEAEPSPETDPPATRFAALRTDDGTTGTTAPMDDGMAEIRVIRGGKIRHIAVRREADTRHTAWCLDRYRSYRTEDDSYMSYSGVRRPCISPFADTASAGHEHREGDDSTGDVAAGSEAILVSASGNEWGPVMTRQHIMDCFSRYRSYRPEDNSYQPYGGGPRRQCR